MTTFQLILQYTICYYYVLQKYVVVPPPGKAPASSIQPGQPGGGMYPKANRFAASLAPKGNINSCPDSSNLT